MAEYLVFHLVFFFALALLDLLILKTKVLLNKAFYLTGICGIVIGILWETIALSRGHWFYGGRFLMGLYIFDVPLENLVVYLIIILLPVVIWEFMGTKKHTS